MKKLFLIILSVIMTVQASQLPQDIIRVISTILTMQKNLEEGLQAVQRLKISNKGNLLLQLDMKSILEQRNKKFNESPVTNALKIVNFAILNYNIELQQKTIQALQDIVRDDKNIPENMVTAINSGDVRNIESTIQDLTNEASSIPLKEELTQADLDTMKKLLHAGAYVTSNHRPLMNLISNWKTSKKNEAEIRKKLLKLLIEKGANVNEVIPHREYFSGGETALMQAARENNLKAIELLVAAGADMNLQDKKGYTALMHAIKNKATEAAKLLIEAGANLTIENKFGLTPIKEARMFDNDQIIKLLEEKIVQR